MKYFIICLSYLAVSTNLLAKPPEVSKKFEKELVRFFDSNALKKVKIEELCEKDDLFFMVFDGDKEVGLVVLTSARGRYDKFDFMLVYNNQYKLELIKILTYRSQYGSEITAKRWLSQFYSKESDSLKYGSDVQAISGATFSAISITKNINRINKVVKEYSKE